MSLPNEISTRIDHTIDTLRDTLTALSLKIHAHPELRFEEHRAAAWIAETLRAQGHAVEAPFGGLATSFRARAGDGGARVAILAEYDALPEIGHACGHNLIAASAVGAWLAVAPLARELAGAVDLIGTPAEEGGGGKILLARAGAFEGVDAAMMFHPFDRDLVSHPALASVWLTMKYHGQPAHAAAAPWDGNSALTACMQTFALVDTQRVHFRDGVRVHGFITNGGQAVNIIPEHAASEFSVRARDGAELDRVRAIVERCARGAAMACGVDVEISVRQGYREMRNNMHLARALGRHLSSMGRGAVEHDERVGAGSTDMGDVSHVVPSIHPWLAICDAGETLCHQHAFERAAASPRGLDTMLTAARAMARTTAEFLLDASLRDAVRAEFEARIS
jgi:amidohydrolase